MSGEHCHCDRKDLKRAVLKLVLVAEAKVGDLLRYSLSRSKPWIRTNRLVVSLT